jgi:hypothetical protein
MSEINHRGRKWDRVGRLAARQHGVVSRNQLRELGVTDASIDAAVATGRLHPGFRGTFGVGHPPSGHRAWTLAGVLACGPGAVASHLSAAHLLGLSDRRPVSIELIARGESGRGIDGVRRHHVPCPCGPEAGHCDAIPCTSPSRTIVDLAGMLSERPLRRLIERAAVHGLLDLPAIERVLLGGRRRGAPMLRRILHDWRSTRPTRGASGRVDGNLRLWSDLEARLLALIGSAALPTPLCNRPIDADGRRVVVDFLWPEQRLVVETDGKRFHDNPVAFERDRLRDRALQLGGYRVVHFTYRQVEEEPAAVLTAIRRLLDAAGG